MSARQGRIGIIHGRLPVAAVLAVAAGLLAPGAASAGTVGLSGGQMSFVADDGQANTVTVTGGAGQITIRDEGHDVLLLPFTDAQSACSHPTSDSATCPATSVDVQAGDLNDTVDATAANIAGPGNVGGVFLNGGDGPDTLRGGPAVDTLSGDSGDDTLDGGASNDFLTGGDDNDTLSGGPGDDSFEVVAFATLGNDTINGDAGDDTLVQPQRGISSLGDGGDTFHGGSGVDTASYGSSTDPVALSLDGLPDDGYANEGDNLGTDVENVIGGPGGDTIAGNDAANMLDGGAGGDSVNGMGGADDLRGGPDSDTVVGGDGSDRMGGGEGDDQLQGGSGDDSADGNGGADTMTGGDGVDAMAGGPGSDTVDGGAGDDDVRGGDASGVGADAGDAVSGGSGSDRVEGDGGDDMLVGDSGADAIAGGAGTDTADYRGGSAAVEVTIDDKANDGGQGEHDNVESDVENVDGGNHDSTVVGTAGENTLVGGGGEDYSDGASGQDTFEAGAAGDTVRSRDGIPDTVNCGRGPDFAIADPQDTVKASCERVDRGTSKPSYRKTVLAKPAGTNLLKMPGVRRFVPLHDTVGLPLGTTLNPLSRRMTLVAASPSGARQTGTFSGGAFLVKQPPGSPVMELQLAGTFDLRKCGKAKATAARSHKVQRRLFGNAHGRFRTRGRYSSATVRGTRWSVEDRCDGTLTKVTRGTVVVHDFGRRRDILVRAGRSYLARRGNR